jgi:hypothetical protein
MLRVSPPRPALLAPLALARRQPLPPFVVGNKGADDNQDTDDAEDQLHVTTIFLPSSRPIVQPQLP